MKFYVKTEHSVRNTFINKKSECTLAAQYSRLKLYTICRSGAVDALYTYSATILELGEIIKSVQSY
jgi:hypothetical protein